MAERYDVLAVRKYKTRDGEEKSSWTNVGVAFANKDGKGYMVTLHCIPVPDKETGEVRLMLREPMPKDGQRGGGGGRQQSGGGYSGNGDDDTDLPF